MGRVEIRSAHIAKYKNRSECRQANILMMKYMDCMLTESEARCLNVHIVKCSVCKEDFLTYESMAAEFEADSVSLFEPPEGFEQRVMEIVSRIEPDFECAYSQDTVVGFVFGAFSMLFGTGVVISMFREEISGALSIYPAAAAVISAAAKTSDTAYAFAGEISDRILYYLYIFSGLIETAKYGILAVIAALVAAQCVIYSKNKAEA